MFQSTYQIPAIESPFAAARRKRRRARSRRGCKYGARKNGKCPARKRR